MADVQELDNIIGNLDTSETPECAPLLLGWATFLRFVHDSQAPFQVRNPYLNGTDRIGLISVARQSKVLMLNFDSWTKFLTMMD